MTGDEYAAWLQGYQKQVNDAVEQGTADAMPIIADAAASITPVQTGRLKAGWRYTRDSVTNDVPYAGTVMPDVWSDVDADGIITSEIEKRMRDIK